MFIKRTKSRTRQGTKTYLQIVQSFYDQGRVRQHVVANLGPDHAVDPDTAQALVAALNAGTTDSLPEEQMNLLKTQNYGDLYLLHSAFVASGLERFFHDMGSLYSIGNLSDSVFFLLAYAILCKDPQTGIQDWLPSYYLLGKPAPTNEDFQQAVQLLQKRDLLSHAMQSVRYETKSIPKFHYRFLCNVRYTLEPFGTTEKRCCVITKPDTSIQNIEVWNKTRSDFAGSEYIVADISEDPLSYAAELSKSGLLYLLQVPHQAVDPEWTEKIRNINPPAVIFGQNSIRECFLGHVRMMIVQPVSAEFQSKESQVYDIFLTNSAYPLTDLLNLLTVYARTSEHLYEILFPNDLSLSAPDAEKILPNLGILKLLVMDKMEARLPTTWMAEDLLNAFQEMRAATLSYRKGIRVFHTNFTPEQLQIAETLGMHNIHLNAHRAQPSEDPLP